MSILGNIKKKFQAEQQTAATKRQAEWTEYRKLLSRVDGLKRGDEQRLEELVRTLDIDPAHIEAHPAILAEYDRLQAQQKDQPKAEADYKAILEKEGDLRKQMGLLGDRLMALQPERDRLLGEITYCQHDLPRQIDLMKKWFANILGVANVKPIGKLGAELPQYLIDNPKLRESLGIVQSTPWDPGRHATPEDLVAKAETERDTICRLKKQCEADEMRLEDLTHRCDVAKAELQRQTEAGHAAEDVVKAVKELTFEIEQVNQSLKVRLAHIKEVATCN